MRLRAFSNAKELGTKKKNTEDCLQQLSHMSEQTFPRGGLRGGPPFLEQFG